MESLIIVVHVLAAIGITGLVLIQHGKGADMGASFGSGASQTIFGSVGSGNALTKSTAWLATVFFATSLVLALFAKQQAGQSIANDGLIQNTGILSETPLVPDLPQVQSVASDLPQASAAQDLPEADATAEAVQDEAAEVAEPVETAEEAEQAEAAETPAQ